jgi:hypothetical protein
VLAQQGVVDTGLVVEAVEERARGELDQIAEPGRVARQEHQVVAARARRIAVGVAGRSHVGLDADDRLDAALLGLLVELDRAEEVAVVGQRQRRHPGRLGGVQDVTDPIGAVEQAVLAVKVEVDEVRHPGDYPTALSRGAPSRRAAMRLARTM